MYLSIVPFFSAATLLLRQNSMNYFSNAMILIMLASGEIVHAVSHIVVETTPYMNIWYRFFGYMAIVFFHRFLTRTYMTLPTSTLYWCGVGTLTVFDIILAYLQLRFNMLLFVAAVIAFPFQVGSTTRRRFALCFGLAGLNGSISLLQTYFCLNEICHIVFDVFTLCILMCLARTLLVCEQCYIIATYHKRQ